jgi:hypothetical protein
MGGCLWGVVLTVLCASLWMGAQCANDQRSEKKGGVVVTDFTITGTRTLSASQLAEITGDFIGSCFNDDSEEMAERVRAEFQNEGYFRADVKHVTVKASDPLGNPKPVLVEADVDEGLQYRLDRITFLENHAFSAETLRDEFPLKKGDVFSRHKVASGLEAVRKLYARNGYLDMYPVPDTEFAAAAELKITVKEGPQYHMGKLEIPAEKDLADRLRLAWKLDEGVVFDSTYLDKYIEENHDLLPSGFGRERVQVAENCPEATVAVRLAVQDDSSKPPMKDVPCEKKDGK